MATQTLFTLPQAQRGPLSGFTTPSFTVPVGATSITVTTNIALADLADSTKSLTLGIQCLKNSVWSTEAEFTWQGGGNDKAGNPNTQSPVMTFTVADMDGTSARGIISIPIAITVGAVVTSN